MENIYSSSKFNSIVKLRYSLINDLFLSFTKHIIRLKFCSTFLLFVLVQTSGFAQTNTWEGSLTNSNWETGSNWSLNHIPTALEDVVIPAYTLTTKPSISVAGAVCKSLTISNIGLLTNNTLTIAPSGTLVTGAIIINAPAGLLTNSTAIAVGSGSLTASSITMNGADSSSGTCILSISTGIINVSGSVVMNGLVSKNQVTFSGSGTLNIGGTITGGGLTSGTGTVNYNNLGNQNIGTYTYNNLTISGSGIKTLVGNTLANNILSVKANTTLALETFTLGSPASVLLECGATTGSVVTGTVANGFKFGTSVTVTNIGTGTSGAIISCPSDLEAATIFTIDDSPAAADLSIGGVLNGIGTESVTKTGAGTLLLTATGNSYTGANIITAGVLQLGTNGVIANSGPINMKGGTFSTGVITGFTDDVGTLQLTENATIALGTGNHTLTFDNSQAISWTPGKTLTITGWAGIARQSGTAGKIYVGSLTGLTASQLAQIRFTGYTCSAMILPTTFEIVPSDNTATLSSAVGTDNQTKCINTAITNITYTTAGATGIGIPIGLPTGVTAVWASNTITISGTPAVPGTYNYTIPLTGGCGNANVIGTIKVNAMPIATISSTAANACMGDSSPIITFANPQTEAITVTYTINSGLNQTINVAGSSTSTLAVSTAAAGSFLYQLVSVIYQGTPNCNNGLSNSATVTINPAPTLATATQTIFACGLGSGSPASIKLTGLLNESFTVDYTIDGVPQTQITGLTAVTGEASFSTRNLLIGDNNKLLQITGINTTTCSKNFAGIVGIDINLNVKSDSGPITITPGSTFNSGDPASSSELTEVVFSIAPIAGASSYNWVISPDWTIVSTDVTTNAITVKTGTRFQGNNNVEVTASNMLCPSSVMVDLSPIAPQAPVKNTVTNVTCRLLGSVALTNLPIGNWYLTKFKDGGIGVPDITRTGSSFTVDNLTAGTYTFTVTDDYGTSLESDPIIINDLETNIWNGSWSKGADPVIDDNVIFDADFNKLGSVDACSCKISSTATVTIASGDVMIVENALDVEGNLIFESGASLVQVNDVPNDGIITYKRSSSPLNDYDYVYWCAPLEGQTLGGVVPGNNKAWSYEMGEWKEASGAMLPAKGYIVRYSNALHQNAVFVGKPNNGDYSIAVQATGSNLIGNPYPSAIDAKKFMLANGTGSLYFWTHNTEREKNEDGTKYIYSANDYASFNGVGGVQAVSGGTAPDGTIAAAQSFFVATGSGSDFKFTNAMRIDVPGKNNLFYKQGSAKKDINNDINRVWLNLTNDQGAFKQLLIGYVTGATNDFDYSYDAPTLNGNIYVDFYSIGNSKNYTIQGLGLPFDAADEVPLGYSSTIEGMFQISINKVDGGMINQTIYLEDKTANTFFDLTKGPYSFITAKGEFKDRFVLRYSTAKLAIDDVAANGKRVVVSVKNKQIKINSFDRKVSSVKLFDFKGSLLYEKNKLNDNEFIIDNLTSGTQFMIVMIQLEDSKWISEEIIFQD